MRILFIGDIMGRTGRNAVFDLLPGLRDELEPDIVIANGENASGGLGMNRSGYEELRRGGVDYFTMGNHTFSKKDVFELFRQGENIVRPANSAADQPGEGFAVIRAKNGCKIGIINLIGRVFMNEKDLCPFKAGRELAERVREITPVVFVDFHAEATSEKEALGCYLDGLASAVIGTHTHVQTADERVLPGGTAYMTDAGRTGAVNSVLGMDAKASVSRFLDAEKKLPFRVAGGRYMLCGALIDVDEETGKARGIERICRYGG